MTEAHPSTQHCQIEYDISVEAHRIEMAQEMRSGKPLGVQNATVVALWGAPEAAETIREIKGRDNRPFGLTVPFSKLIEKGLVDYNRVEKSARELIDPDKYPDGEHGLDNRMGALGFVRLPAKQQALEEAGVPLCAISYENGDKDMPIIQNYSPLGHTYVADLLSRSGIECPIVTSMNKTGEPEIVTAEDAIKFTAECNRRFPQINLKFLRDRNIDHDWAGSYPIVSMDTRGIELVRQGNLSAYVIGHLLSPHFLEVRDSRTLAPQKGRKPLQIEPGSALYGLEGHLLHDRLVNTLPWAREPSLAPKRGGPLRRIISKFTTPDTFEHSAN